MSLLLLLAGTGTGSTPPATVGGAPAVQVHLGYGSTWQTEDAAITWTEETSRVNDRRELVSIMRGATSAHGKAGAGKLNLTLNNPGRRFDPLHTAGPLFGDLVPGVPIKVTIGGVQVGRGFVKSWPQHPDGATFTVVPVEAVDGFQNLSRAPTPTSVLEWEILQDSPLAYWPLTETAGTSMRDASTNSFDGEFAVGTTDLAATRSIGSVPFDGLQMDGEHYGDVPDQSSALLSRPCVATYVGLMENLGTGTLVVPYRAGTGNPAEGLVLASEHHGEQIDLSGGFRNVADGYVFGETTVVNRPSHVAFRIGSTGAAKVYADGVDVSTLNLTVTTPVVAPPGSVIGGAKSNQGGFLYEGWLGHVAIFDTDIGEARIEAHADAVLNARSGEGAGSRIGWLLDVIDWPSDLRDLDPGQSKLGPAIFDRNDNALSYFQLVEASEDGRLFISRDGKLTLQDRYFPFTEAEATISQFTFSDVKAENRGYADFVIEPQAVELVFNAYSYSRRNGAELRDVDTASKVQHGYREDSQNDLLLRTDNEVRARGDWTLLTRATPLPQVDSIRVPLHKYSSADQTAVLSLDLGHRVSAVRTPQGIGDPIELDFIVSGIRIAAGVAECWVELYVSPAVSDEITLFTLGTSTLGGTDVLAY